MTNKIKYFIGNWKMFGDLTSFKIINELNKFRHKFKKLSNKNRVIICVPNTLIYFFKNKLKNKLISLGVQNCHQSQIYGSFTGSVNASMLKKTGAEFIILGHSENRFDGETNKLIKKKIQSALDVNLNIIFCIGETLKEKNNRKTFSAIKKQIKESIEKNFDINKIIFAYEPVWSVGTNKVPKIDDLTKTVKFIKLIYKKIYKSKKIPRVLYGGSVNKQNIRTFSSISCIDGFLIGRESQSSKKFIDIIKNYYK
jgi:triosephosphate isomerase (TIM)